MKHYATIDYSTAEHERCLIRDGPAIEVQRPFEGPPILSGKDRELAAFLEAECFE